MFINYEFKKKSFQKEIEMHAHFERPCNKLKNASSKLKILESKLANLKKFKNLPILCLNFNYISVFKFWF